MRVNQANSAPVQNSESSSTKKSDKAKAYEGKSSESSAANSSASNSESAKTDISSKARDMAKAKQLAADAPDVRDAKIAALKEKIQNKSYHVSADAIADKLVDDHLSF